MRYSELLPLISEEARESVLNEIFQDVNAWRKAMIHSIKDKNPEVNAAIIESAEKTGLDPKSIALGAYMTYRMLEAAEVSENAFFEDIIS